MDIFLEKIIKKKRDVIDNAIIYGSIIVAVFLVLLIIGIFGPYGYSLIICAAIGYGVYLIITSRKLEFEYALTNGEIDIDKIVAQRKRKRLISANCKELELFAKITSDKYNSSIEEIPDRIKAVTSMDSEDIYFFIVNEKNKRVVVFFEPDDKMLKVIKTIIPRKVFE